MANDYYNVTGAPVTGSQGLSSLIRAEYSNIASGFNKLPPMTGFGAKAVIVNTGGTALTTTVGSLALAGNFTTTGAYSVTLAFGAAVTVSFPVVSGLTLATLTGTETLTNKTLTAPTLTTPTITNPAFSGTSTGSLTLTAATLPSPVISGTMTGTYTIGGTPTGTLVQALATGSTTARSLGTRFNDFINIKDWGAIGDGATSDQTAVAAAIAAAVASGQEVYWPKGTYLTTATIPTFHSARHRGPGIHKRGATLFYVDPSLNSEQINNLYVATTGNDTNDGLASTEPRLTVQSMANVIYTYTYGNVTWKINMAAGTYSTTGTTFSAPFPSPQRVQFLGVSVGDGVQPTVLVVAATPTTDTTGFYFQNYIRAQVSDINFKTFRTGASPSANLLGSGLVGDTNCEIYTRNVWTDDCDQGIYITNRSEARIQAGRHGFNAINGANFQFIRHSSGSVGYNGTLADVNGVTGVAMIGGSYGVMIQEFSMVHTDTCYFSTQTLAGVFVTTGRVHSVSSTYFNCVVGIDGRMNANIGMTTNTFTGCTTDTISRSGAVYAGVQTIAVSTSFSPPMKVVNTLAQSTSSATPVAITLPGGTTTVNFVAKEFQTRGMGFQLTLYGNCTGVANTKTVTILLNAVTLLTATIAAATTDFKIIVKLAVVTSGTIQYLYTEIIQNGVTPTVDFTTTAVAENLDAASTLTGTSQVTNVADSIRLGMIELEEQH